jgi:mono/diheme cytochrome c family protein
MKNAAVMVATVGLVMATVAMVGCGADSPVGSVVSAEESPKVARGRYLVAMMGCNDCHTPLKMTANGPEPDMERYLSGHPEQIGVVPPATLSAPYMWGALPTNTAFSGPWGVSYTMNLTPDRNTGLGIWTEDMFVAAIKTGRHMGTSRPINPPMPWPAFRNGTEEDLRSIFAYLRTIKPIVNHIPDYQPPAAPVATH